MSERAVPNVAYQFALRRVLIVEEVIDEWEVNHQQAHSACDVDDLVAETAGLLDPISRAVGLMNNGIESDTPTSHFILAHNIGSMLTKASRLYPKVRGVAESMKRRGCAVGDLSRLDESETKVRQLQSEFARKWMLPDFETVAAAQTDLAAGRFRVL